jgi:hypothetical protein
MKSSSKGVLAALLLLACAVPVFLPEPNRQSRSNERSAATTLLALSAAEEDFRQNDRDENGVPDYWRADVAGLYVVKAKNEAIRLIELSCAAADDRPIIPAGPRAPKAGYWFRAMRFAGEDKPHATRFAFCAFPDQYPGTGRFTYIIRHGRVIFGKDLGKGGGIDVWPGDPEGEGWRRLD